MNTEQIAIEVWISKISEYNLTKTMEMNPSISN